MQVIGIFPYRVLIKANSGKINKISQIWFYVSARDLPKKQRGSDILELLRLFLGESDRENSIDLSFQELYRSRVVVSEYRHG